MKLMLHSPWPGGLLPMGHLGPIFPMYRAKGGLKAPFTPKIGGVRDDLTPSPGSGIGEAGYIWVPDISLTGLERPSRELHRRDDLDRNVCRALFHSHAGHHSHTRRSSAPWRSFFCSAGMDSYHGQPCVSVQTIYIVSGNLLCWSR